MAQSIRISDRLYEEAATAAGLLGRSLAQQVDHWARMGQATEQMSGLEFDVVNLKLRVQHARDAALVKSGVLHASDLGAIKGSLLKRISVEFPVVDFAELIDDYTQKEA